MARRPTVSVEILSFAGCPSFETLLPRVRDLVGEHGGNPDEITLSAVETLEASVASRFLGSPTVRVDDFDVDPTARRREDFGLKCRLYRSEHGHAPTPPDAWIRTALAAAEASRAQTENFPPD